jgi:myosin heavy subunit
MGLHQRLLRRAAGRGTPVLPGAESARPAAEQVPESLQEEFQAGAGQAISFDEQVQIRGEINDVLRRNRLAIRPDTFTFTARRNGATIPILFNAGAAALTLALTLALVLLFNAGERTLVRRSAVPLTAEAKLIQALKKESAEQLGRKDLEIARVRDSLAALARDRDRLKLESQAQLERREADLKAALARELAAERQKLERSGLQSADVDRQLAALETRLAEAYQKQLDAFRQERTGLEEQARKRQEELTAELREKTAAAQSERGELSGQLARLNEQRERERLASDQLLAAYAKVIDSWRASRSEEALRNLGAVRELLSREAITSLPALQSRLPVERFIVDSLARLFESEKAALAGPAAPVAPATPSEAETRLTELSAKAAEAEQARRRLQEEVSRARQELARLQAGEKRRDAQESQLAALQQLLAAGAGPAADSQAQVLALLEAKLRVRQALSAEPLASRYPGLYEELERYLDAYGREQRQEGQADALQNAAAVLEGLSAKTPRLDARRLKGDYSGAARDSLACFMERLRGLLH